MKAEQFLIPTLLATTLSLNSCDYGIHEGNPIIIENKVSPQSIAKNREFAKHLVATKTTWDFETVLNDNPDLIAFGQQAIGECIKKASVIFPNQRIIPEVNINSANIECQFWTPGGGWRNNKGTYPITVPSNSSVGLVSITLPFDGKTKFTFKSSDPDNFDIKKYRFRIIYEERRSPL